MRTSAAIAVTAVVVGGVGFAGGWWYGSHAAPANTGRFGARSGFMAGDARGAMMGGRFRGGGGMVIGDIVTNDASGITVKLRDGSTKLIVLPRSAHIMKSVDGTAEDLVVGHTVIVMGETQKDGSVVATSVQLRSDLAAPPTRQ